MEATRIVLAAGCFGIAATGFVMLGRTDDALTLRGAELVPMAEGFALTLDIDNPGGADRLVAIGSDTAGQAMLTGASTKGALAIPAGSTPSLAMDGAHGMIIGLIGDAGEGRLVPVALWFENAGKIETRARISSAAMDHSALHDVPAGEPAPDLTLTVTPEGDGWAVTLETVSFTFSQNGVDGPHQPGTGHAHLYLGGLKLGRLYAPNAMIGTLPPGEDEVRVTLNTNDHRAYAVNGRPVTATARIAAD